MVVRVVIAIVIGGWLGAAPTASAQAPVVDLKSFCDVSSLTLNGTAASLNPNPQCVLRLTDDLNQGGSAFSTNPFSLAVDASFSTFFCFRISNPVGLADGDGPGADGFVFTVQTVANNVGGVGGGLGYQGIANSVGVEFDTFFNGAGFGDPDGNHVGIDVNGNIVSVATAPIAARLNDGAFFCAWVDYNGATQSLEVRVAPSQTRPANALLVQSLDLVTVLGSTDAFVGFTAGTAAGGNTHDILSAIVIPAFAPIDLRNSAAPALSTQALLMTMLLLVVAGILSLTRARSRSRRQSVRP